MKRWIENFFRDEEKAKATILNWIFVLGMISGAVGIGSVLMMK